VCVRVSALCVRRAPRAVVPPTFAPTPLAPHTPHATQHTAHSTRAHLVGGAVQHEQRHVHLAHEQVVGEDVAPRGPPADVWLEHAHARQQRRVQHHARDARLLRGKPHLRGPAAVALMHQPRGERNAPQVVGAQPRARVRGRACARLFAPRRRAPTVGPEPTDCPYRTTCERWTWCSCSRHASTAAMSPHVAAMLGWPPPDCPYPV
jgi:hypothetical protein